MKKRSLIPYIPSPQYPLLVEGPDEILLDPDFDDIEEVILSEPPLLATRRCGGYLTRLNEEPEEDE